MMTTPVAHDDRFAPQLFALRELAGSGEWPSRGA
jgi:hypothetical protein